MNRQTGAKSVTDSKNQFTYDQCLSIREGILHGPGKKIEIHHTKVS